MKDFRSLTCSGQSQWFFRSDCGFGAGGGVLFSAGGNSNSKQLNRVAPSFDCRNIYMPDSVSMRYECLLIIRRRSTAISLAETSFRS